jgi:F-type H+-transporting ATPase subunit gamma
VLRAAERALRTEVAAGREYSLVVVGQKARKYFSFRGYRIEKSYTGFTEAPTYEHAREIAGEVVARFLDGGVDQVELAYTRFLSLSTQRVEVRRFLPLESAAVTEAHDGPTADYEFEPDPTEILDRIVPRYVESRLFAALLDAAASELAARQRAMKSATDNADELITILRRRMNRARQDSITTELIEIASGAEALAQAASGEVDYLRDRMEDPELFHRVERKLDRRSHPHEEHR